MVLCHPQFELLYYTDERGNRTEYFYDKKGNLLTERTPDGESESYDVNPYVKGQNRGAERIVIGDDDSVWYTNDHYHTFIKDKDGV